MIIDIWITNSNYYPGNSLPYFFFLEKYMAIPAQPSATIIKAINAINKKPVAIFILLMYIPVHIFYAGNPYRLPLCLLYNAIM